MDECQLVLTQWPDLTAAGFRSLYEARHERENARRFAQGRSPESRTQLRLIGGPDARREISLACRFLRENCCWTKTIRRAHSSYGLKREAEAYMGEYISNGAFIAAACLEGYGIEREGPNACFALSFTLEYRRCGGVVSVPLKLARFRPIDRTRQ